MTRFTLISAAWLAVAGSLSAQNGVPEKIAYTGFLADAGSVAVGHGEHRIAFRIYDVEEDGDPVWESTRTLLSKAR